MSNTDEQTRKRPLEDGANGGNNKRFNSGNEPLLKVLVPNYVAGALIGKGGSLMKEMKEQHGGNIRLSRKEEIYPGTDERIIVLTGETKEIIDLNNVVMEKLQIEHKQHVEPGRSEKVKIVLTNAAAGLLIGKGGVTIKSIHQESKAKITIANPDKVTVPGERVLTMFGSMEQRKDACRMIIEKISGDASNMANTMLKYYLNGSIGISAPKEVPMQYNNPELITTSYPVKNARNEIHMQYNNPEPNRYPLKSERNRYQDKSERPIMKTKVTVEMEVPEKLVGPIMGKQGHIIRDIAQKSGTRLQFSKKDEYAEGTDRVLTITAGDLQKANIAYSLVNARIEELVSESNGPPPNHNEMVGYSLLGGY